MQDEEYSGRQHYKDERIGGVSSDKVETKQGYESCGEATTQTMDTKDGCPETRKTNINACEKFEQARKYKISCYRKSNPILFQIAG